MSAAAVGRSPNQIAARAGARRVSSWLDDLRAINARNCRQPQLVGCRRGHGPAARRRWRGGFGGACRPASQAVADPLERTTELRTHPHTVHHRCGRSSFGLGLRAADVLGRLTMAMVRGDSWPRPKDPPAASSGARVLRNSAAQLATEGAGRAGSTAAYGRSCRPGSTFPLTRASTGWRSSISFAGVRIPASAIEPLVLAPRIRDYSPAMLDGAAREAGTSPGRAPGRSQAVTAGSPCTPPTRRP